MALLFAFGYFPPEWPMSRSVNAALISTVAASNRRREFRRAFDRRHLQMAG
jgi:hypothetical protein